MLLMFLYVFSIIFRSQVQGCSYLEASYFSSTQHAMWTLLLHGTLLDAVSVVAEDILAYSALLAATFLLSIFVTSFTVLNMLIGIIVGVVTSVKIDESERKAKKQLQKQLKDIMDVYDSDNTKSLNRVEFGLFIANPDVQRVLKQFEVDTWGLSNLAEHLFDDSDHEGTLLFEQILDVVVRLRGDNKIRMADVVQLRKFTDQRFEQTRALLTKHLSGGLRVSCIGFFSVCGHCDDALLPCTLSFLERCRVFVRLWKHRLHVVVGTRRVYKAKHIRRPVPKAGRTIYVPVEMA
jgi:hypothetical protein